MFDLTQNLVITVLWVVFGVVKIWAFVDCVRRPAAAFPAVGRVSKVLWLILTGVAMLTGFIPGFGGIGEGGLLNVFELQSIIFGLLIILFLILEPRGLYGLWLRLRNYFKAWPFSY